LSGLHCNGGSGGDERGIRGRDQRGGVEGFAMETPGREIIRKVQIGEETMGPATHEQANLMLRLFEMRREAKLREAREWFGANFHVKTLEDVNRLCPPGSRENAYMRMVLGYWEMVASIVNRGLIDEDLFFETAGEQWNTWDQVKPVIGAWREAFKNPTFFANLEEHCRRFETWREKRAPGSNEAIRNFLAQGREATGAARAQAAD
jgi:hypothetical protein